MSKFSSNFCRKAASALRLVKSDIITRSAPGYCTLTATTSPVLSSVALCTCYVYSEYCHVWRIAVAVVIVSMVQYVCVCSIVEPTCHHELLLM
jgi:hypothetical protein